MVTIERNNKETFFGNTDLKKVAKQIKYVNKEYINEKQNNITEAFIEYALPLIQGEVEIPYLNGMPKVYILKK